jgi:endonuclease/exonuclease/phosphatase family metal-dependent hydrolase
MYTVLTKEERMLRRMGTAGICFCFAMLLGLGMSSDVAHAEDFLRITTWNIETLGGEGRGFASGFGQGSLGMRTPEQLEKIAEFIIDEVGSDILAIQEVSVSSTENGVSISEPLEQIVSALGSDWEYYLPEVEFIPDGHENMFCAFLWNNEKVTALDVFAAEVPNISLAGAPLYSRAPLVGYFEAIKDYNGTNDFVLVNVHLKSGQDFDENHIIAIVNLEKQLYSILKDHSITESDRIILGDFNDNPYATKSSGDPKYSRAMYQHMAYKGYVDLVIEGSHDTRMNYNLDSVIDHILRNKGAKKHILDNAADIYLPFNGDQDKYPEFRETYSDHFPVSFRLKIENKDDDVDFHD